MFEILVIIDKRMGVSWHCNYRILLLLTVSTPEGFKVTLSQPTMDNHVSKIALPCCNHSISLSLSIMFPQGNTLVNKTPQLKPNCKRSIYAKRYWIQNTYVNYNLYYFYDDISFINNSKFLNALFQQNSFVIFSIQETNTTICSQIQI